MTLQSGPEFLWPVPLYSSTTGSSSVALNGVAGERFAWCFEAPKTGTLSGFSFRTGTVTTGCTVNISLQSLSTSGTTGVGGFPTGSDYSTGTSTTQVIANADDNVWFNVTFSSPASVTKGDKLAVVFSVSSGTPSGLNLLFYGTGQGAVGYATGYISTYNGSAWTYSNSQAVMIGVLNYNGTYEFSQYFYPGFNVATTYNSSTAGADVRGMKFQLPYPTTMVGCTFTVDGDGAFDVNLYDSDGVTKLRVYNVPTAEYPPTTAARVFYIKWDTPINLSANTSYRVCVEPTTTTSVNIQDGTPGNSAWLSASPYLGTTYAQSTSAKDPTGVGSWTDSTTVFPQVGLILSAFDDATSGGGSSTPTVYFG